MVLPAALVAALRLRAGVARWLLPSGSPALHLLAGSSTSASVHPLTVRTVAVAALNALATLHAHARLDVVGNCTAAARRLTE